MALMRGRGLLVVAAGVAVVACAKKQETLLEHLPQGTKAALLVRQSAIAPLLQQWLADPPEMKKELSAYLEKQIAVDLTAVSGIAVFVTTLSPPTAAAMLRLPAGAGTFKGAVAGKHEGVDLLSIEGSPLVGARISTGLLIGTPDGVKLGIDLSKGKAKGIEPTGPLAAMLAADRPEVEVLLGASVELIPEPQVAAMAAQYGVKDLALTVDQQRKISLSVGGRADKLASLKQLAMGAIQKGIKQLEEQKARATAGPDVLAGVGSIMAYHNVARLAKELEPKQVGDRLGLSYQLPTGNAQVMVAVAGIMAAVAIPAFIKYTRKAKSVEATEGIDKIAVGAKAYYLADRYDQAGQLQPHAFPAGSQEWTPAKTCCAQGGKCQPDPSDWNRGPWMALHFQLSDPHYYQYRFTSQGSGTAATFVAEARGDLDCDGVFSSYRVVGKVVGDQVEVSGPIVENEME